MAMLRVYAEIQDEFGVSSTVRIGHTFTKIHKAIEAARKASLKYGVAELKDDLQSVHSRLLEVFRDGRPTLGRLDY